MVVSSASQPTPTDVARRLVRAADRATLATAAADGWPHASLVAAACDHDAAPILMLSSLAEHTRNAAADPRAALLFVDAEHGEPPLEAARLTVCGRLAVTTDPRQRARFLGRHADAARYADFRDFACYRLAVDRALLVAGFGAIHRIDGDALLCVTAGCDALIDAEAEIVAQMNGDHRDAVLACANGLLGLTGGDWRLTGIDPEGCDLRGGAGVARLTFPAPIGDPQEARAMLDTLARQARGT